MNETLMENRERIMWSELEGCQEAFTNWDLEWSFVWPSDLESGQMGSDIRDALRKRLVLLALGESEFNEERRNAYYKSAQIALSKIVGWDGD